jgi:N-acetylmuramoyl-L-alanine amidase
MSPCRPGRRRLSHALRARSSRRSSASSGAARTVAVVTALVLASSASYTVVPGDTLSGIAARLGFPARDLASANGLSNPNRIYAGQRLNLPGSATGSGSAQPQPGSHVVALGETLSGIAAKYGVAVSDLAQANDLRSADRIRAGARLVIPGSAPGSGGAERPSRSASRSEVGDLIERTAREHGWNPSFVKALAWQESGWNNGVVSSVGARGIMQVMPYTGDFVSSNLAGRRLDLTDPGDNVLAGVLFLQHLHELTGGDPRMILAGYYQGLASVRRNGVYESTERYIDNVLALKGRF